MDVRTAIATRRSHKIFAGQPVADAALTELVELAIWAPNHKQTEPWRFAVVRHAKIGALADAVEQSLVEQSLVEQSLVDGLADRAAAMVQSRKIRGILSGAGAVIALISPTNPDDPVRDREDYAACACAMQNIQLGAWAQGLGSYWTTSPAMVGPGMASWWGVAPGEELVGAIVLGVPAAAATAHRKKRAVDITTYL